MTSPPRPSLLASFLSATLTLGLLTDARSFADSTNCVMAPAGIVSWWRAEGNAQDATGANHGALAGNTTVGTGRVGQAFVFDGNNDAVNLGNPTNLQLQNFTLEVWVKRASATVTSLNSPTFGNLFAHGWGGYALGIESNGRLYLGRVGLSSVGIDGAVADTNWHHLAATKPSLSQIRYRPRVLPPGLTLPPPASNSSGLTPRRARRWAMARSRSPIGSRSDVMWRDLIRWSPLVVQPLRARPLVTACPAAARSASAARTCFKARARP